MSPGPRRGITTTEGFDARGNNLPLGSEVWQWTGFTYGVISDEGVAVSLALGEPPFFEMPRYAVKWRTS